MQQINTERQQTNGRLVRQLPANLIEQTTSPTHQKHAKKNTTKSPNYFKKITDLEHAKSSIQHRRTDQGDFDTDRSLSTCPTYSSLSRQSHETRDCATQIITLPRTEPIENIPVDSPRPIDDNPEVLPDDVVLMPISSGFNDYPYYYPNRIKEDVDPQFRDNQREKHQNGSNSQSKGKTNGKLPPARATVVKRSPRSDTFILPTKRQTVDPKVSKTKPASNPPRRMPSLPKEPAAKNPTPPPQRRRLEPVHRDGSNRPAPRYPSSSVEHDLGRRPVRFADRREPAYRSSPPPPPPPPPVRHQKPARLPRETSDRPRRVRVADQDYVIEHRRETPVEYVYDDYYADAPIERSRHPRRSRVVREVVHPDDDEEDVYYVKPTQVRRPPPRIERSAPREYVYAERIPTRVRPRGSDIVYADDHDRQVEYHDEYVYVDEDGNEVEIVDEKDRRSPEYVEYIYENERDQRRSHQPKVVYVDDEPPIRNRQRSKHPSSTRIVYE